MTKPLPNSRFLPRGLDLLHEDEDILVVDKPAGLLTMANDRERDRTVYAALTEYVRKGQARSRKRVFIVHRLDKDTSGLLVFARSEEAKLTLQEGWASAEKTYLAVVHGQCEQDEGVIESYLTENREHVVFSTSDPSKGKLARTGYRVLQRSADYSLLQIELFTGRKNQIRVHMADLGHPIVGDSRYGDGRARYRRLVLHAHTLAFTHPRTQERMEFTAPVPRDLSRLLGRLDAAVLRAFHRGAAELG